MTVLLCRAGRYSEFGASSQGGIRHADLTGYMYSREDVSARTHHPTPTPKVWGRRSARTSNRWKWKSVVQVGMNGQANEIFRSPFDGSIVDEKIWR